MEKEREVDRRGVEAIIKKSLGYIQSSYPCRLVCKTIKDKFVFADSRNRKFIYILQGFLDIIGDLDSLRAFFSDILLTKHQDICICSQENTEVTHET